jgi:hypothetical protein
VPDPKPIPQGAPESPQTGPGASAPAAPAAPPAGKTSNPGFNPGLSNPGLRLPTGTSAGPQAKPSGPQPKSSGPQPKSSGPPSNSSGPRPATSRPFKGWGAATARGLALFARVVIGLSRFGVSKAKERGGRALTEFNQRPEHTRWRSLAFASYGALVLGTFAVQLWEPNALFAYVLVQKVAMPESTVIFVRNDSKKTWKEVKLQLNGQYSYERNDLAPGQHVQLPVDRFGIYSPTGKVTYAPKELALRVLTIDCDRGHYEQELDK